MMNLRSNAARRAAAVLGLLMATGLLCLGAVAACSAIVGSHGDDMYYLEGMDIIPSSNIVIAPFTGDEPSQIFERMGCRLDTALALYEAEKAEKIAVTGNGEEADTAARYLLERGVPAGDILVDRGGVDLYSSIWRISRAYPDSSLLFCIQEKYVPRADYLAKRLGAPMECVSADRVIYFYNIKERAREHLACVKAVLEAGIFRPTPQVPLTDSPIEPLSESGAEP